MTARSTRFRAAAVVASLMPLLAACGGLLPKPPERDVYRLTPVFAFASPLRPVAAQLVVAQPAANAGIDTKRIALSRTSVSLDYYADAEWADRAPSLVQTAIIQGFEKSGALPGVASDASDVRADWVLNTEIRDFEAVYDSPDAAPRTKVGLYVQLIRMPERRIVARTSINRDATASAKAVPEIVRAFDTALGSAVQDLVTWVATNPALSGKPR